MYLNLEECQKELHGVTSIGFYLAKGICRDLDVPNHPVLFHLVISLIQGLGEGNSCIDLCSISEKTFWETEGGEKGYTFPPETEIVKQLEELNLREPHFPITLEEDRVYFRRYWSFETECSEQLRFKMKAIMQKNTEAEKEVLDTLFPPTNCDSEIDWQKAAVALALSQSLMIIAGGPGTGKTFTIAKLLTALQRLHGNRLKIALTAPTGKAAQRMKESIGLAKNLMKQSGVTWVETLDSVPEKASTLHRLLGMRRDSSSFRHHKNNPLPYDLIVVDEVSMIDLPLITRLLRAIPPSSRLILIGDPNQLPSVSSGNVFYDLAGVRATGYSQETIDYIRATTELSLPYSDPSRDHVVWLQKSHRFNHKDGIGLLAQHVINGNAKKSWQLLGSFGKGLPESSQFEKVTLAPVKDFDHWLKELVRRYYAPIFQEAEVEKAFEAHDQFRVLATTHIGKRGVKGLNQTVEAILSELLPTSSSLEGSFYHGKPVMVTENHYGLNLFNGDIGLIWRQSSGELMAAFRSPDLSIRWISPSRLPTIETVYAMTIHKTQGSEYNHVALILPTKKLAVLSRELIYTGITRARSFIDICSDQEIWDFSVQHHIRRFSGLSKKLHHIGGQFRVQ